MSKRGGSTPESFLKEQGIFGEVINVFEEWSKLRDREELANIKVAFFKAYTEGFREGILSQSRLCYPDTAWQSYICKITKRSD